MPNEDLCSQFVPYIKDSSQSGLISHLSHWSVGNGGCLCNVGRVVYQEFVERITGELRPIVCDKNVRYAMSSKLRLEVFNDLVSFNWSI